jgi:hypothetical protein
MGLIETLLGISDAGTIPDEELDQIIITGRLVREEFAKPKEKASRKKKEHATKEPTFSDALVEFTSDDEW